MCTRSIYIYKYIYIKHPSTTRPIRYLHRIRHSYRSVCSAFLCGNRRWAMTCGIRMTANTWTTTSRYSMPPRPLRRPWDQVSSNYGDIGNLFIFFRRWNPPYTYTVLSFNLCDGSHIIAMILIGSIGSQGSGSKSSGTSGPSTISYIYIYIYIYIYNL